jgi:hypothetical protein
MSVPLQLVHDQPDVRLFGTLTGVGWMSIISLILVHGLQKLSRASI